MGGETGVGDKTNGGAYPLGQTLVQSPHFRQSTPELRWLSRDCDVSPSLILNGCFFGVVDHEYVDHDFPGLQFESKLLFLQGGENREPAGAIGYLPFAELLERAPQDRQRRLVLFAAHLFFNDDLRFQVQDPDRQRGAYLHFGGVR